MVTATLFLVVAIIHLLRIIFGWSVEIGGLSIPFWASWLDVLVACSRIPRLHAEQVAQRGRPPVATNRSTMPLPWGGQFENHRAVPWILTSFKEHRSSRMDPILHVSCAPEPNAERIIGDGLNAFNDATVGYADRVTLHVLVSDPDSGKIVGGITGRTSLGLMFIDLVYLPEILRGRDIGARMMALAEEEARRRGCRAGVRSASRHRGSISVSADAYLVKSPAIHREPAVSFLPNIFAEAVKPVALRCSQRASLNPLTETPQTAPAQRRRSRFRSKPGMSQTKR